MKHWWIALALACGCSKDNANYCPNAPQQNCSEMHDAGPDVPLGCQTQAECVSTSTPVCDLGTHQCVQCNADHLTTCPAASPVCDVANEACRACQSHAECGSPGACLLDGTCGTDTNVAWVASIGSDNGTCTHDAPCATITHALAQARTYIKVSGTGTITDQPTIATTVTILADSGAKLMPSAFGAVMAVHGTGTVTIHDLTITGGGQATGDGIYVPAGESPMLVLDHVTLSGNTGRGLDQQGGTLTAARCTVTANTAGGIDLTVTSFDIANTFIVRNGSSTTTGIGGAKLAATSGSSSRFAFNTIVDNSIPTTSLQAGGVTCDIVGFTGPNNLFARNFVNNSATAANSNYIGACTYPTSVNATAITGLNFLSADNIPYDYHLGAGSTAIDQAVTAMSIDDDVDGDHRPQGAAKDQGADEYK
jgi:hypothetical protein